MIYGSDEYFCVCFNGDFTCDNQQCVSGSHQSAMDTLTVLTAVMKTTATSFLLQMVPALSVDCVSVNCDVCAWAGVYGGGHVHACIV